MMLINLFTAMFPKYVYKHPNTIFWQIQRIIIIIIDWYYHVKHT